MNNDAKLNPICSNYCDNYNLFMEEYLGNILDSSQSVCSDDSTKKIMASSEGSLLNLNEGLRKLI